MSHNTSNPRSLALEDVVEQAHRAANNYLEKPTLATLIIACRKTRRAYPKLRRYLSTYPESSVSSHLVKIFLDTVAISKQATDLLLPTILHSDQDNLDRIRHDSQSIAFRGKKIRTLLSSSGGYDTVTSMSRDFAQIK